MALSCSWSCHLVLINTTPSLLSSLHFKNGKELWNRQNRSVQRRRFEFVVSAQLTNHFSATVGLDSKLPWIGPVPGDIAEVEAYCRIFRAAERLHNAFMKTLCNPVTGECSVSYGFPSEDKPLLEDKIVSVLGCMICLLNKGREDLLAGRSSMTASFSISDVDISEDKLPPLASFRTEMKRYCESLHVALEDYLTPDDIERVGLWRKLQRLKNVCYDSGYPRQDGSPCHTLFANWNPVYLSTLKEDIESEGSEIAFYRGSQLTEESLKWLLDKGFKTIVDLREESVKDHFYQAVLDEAVLSQKVELVKLPVEVGTAPTMEQVQKFSLLVSESKKKPIYLHSKEGVWRTSAMVSRWRQYMTHYSSQTPANKAALSNGIVSGDVTEMKNVELSLKLKEDALNNKNGSVEVNSKTSYSSIEKLHKEVSSTSENRNHSDNGFLDTIPFTKTVDNRKESMISAFSHMKPFDSQRPPSNVLSRKSMSQHFKNKKISPARYFNYKRQRWMDLCGSRGNYNGTSLRTENSQTNAESIYQKRESSNGSAVRNVNLVTNGTYRGGGNYAYHSPEPKSNGPHDDIYTTRKSDDHIRVTNGLDKSNISLTMSTDQRNKTAGTVSSQTDGLELIEGNMCVSATGVVRVQSRKKAEMFLVRTDGFSCSREKVTESSLAFTHPSTQQQMLMWKSTPKTVLLLKKLGAELMEEAKEVASFLYHQEKMNVLVEPEVHDIFARIPGFGFVQTFYSHDTSDLHERVDFVACLGGDGVILHGSNLFRGAVPPFVSFNLGSLGFLTSHIFADYRQDLKQVIHGNNTMDGVYITLRLRLRCEIFRNGKSVPGKLFDVLNEIVVDRGSNPYLSKIECYEHDRLITKVQADGVIVATPTGSTAYSTAAGGSMVHPNVPCMLFTPICPHSLSFRPVILPDSARLELKIPKDARSNAWVSFDGKRRQQLSRGDSVRISMSEHPLPTVNKHDQTGDWFRSLIRCLNWNERLDQKAL
ncbi:NAD kinase 2, chloroplastic [Heracleum sosnowskyi]|uniref:NAD(+) kinase n=1 Tax=Heracleum sosnowskyi TaxID=360622 RepID=A0AAD8JKD6_9APIA|nr:NAD kinase 2, chloroplastic [Heracleum sosnowskyi]